MLDDYFKGMIEIIENLTQFKQMLKIWMNKMYDSSFLSNSIVLIKPNMGYPKPAPYTTSLKLIKSAVEILTQLRVKEIIIAEGSTSKTSALENFEITGLTEVLGNYNVKYIDLNTIESVEILIANSKHYLPKILSEVDIRISMPVIKFYNDDQGEFFLSNAVKNYFGLPPKFPYKDKEQSYKRDDLHTDLHKSVCEIYQAVESFSPFNLFICDGLQVLLGEGANGIAKKLGKIILSNNAIEVDLKVLELFNKSTPRYLRHIIEQK